MRISLSLVLVWVGRIAASGDIAEVKAVDVLVKHQVTAAPTQVVVSSNICGWLGGDKGTHFALAIREPFFYVKYRSYSAKAFDTQHSHGLALFPITHVSLSRRADG